MTTPQPRPHQVEALTHLMAGHALHPRMQLIMACGTGKTLVGRWHAQAVDAHQVLVLVPSLGLVAQTLAEWRKAARQANTGWRFRALVVCSDPTTEPGIAERHSDDDSIEISDSTWTDVAAKVTTNPVDVARFLNDTTEPGVARVVFSTYHSSPVITEAQRIARDGFDLAICDEAHRVAGAPSKAFSTILHDRRIVARRRLFMTATPKVLAIASNGVSMDDHTMFGPVAHTISFSDAIEAGLLTDYRVLVATEHADEATYAPAAALVRAVDDYGVRKVLSFHGRVAKAEAFARGINALETSPGGVTIGAEHVSGSMRTSTRLNKLAWLGEPADPNETRIISNARCLSEGVDVPAVDGILFADTRTSVVEIIQAIGRVLRPSPGKTIGTIVLPVAVPADADDDTVLGLSAFEPVWTVLRGLRAHDHRLATELDALTRDLEREPSKRRGNFGGYRLANVEFTFPTSLQPVDLQLRLAEETGSQWERFFARAEVWFETNPGRVMPRGAAAVDGTRGLGEWAHGQQMLHRRGILDPTRTDRLQQLDGWVWDKTIARWWRTHDALLEYARTWGSIAEDPIGESRFTGMFAETQPRRHLGVWMAEQRQAYRLGTLPFDQSTALAKLPGWDWNAGMSDVDVAMVEALRVFTEFEKHARVPDDHLEDGLRLGAWCWAIRRRRWTGNLAPALFDEITACTPSKERIETRFEWDKNETLWRISYFALKQFAEREGHATPVNPVKEDLPDTTIAIGQWCALQRLHHRRGDLEARKVELLAALPGWRWEVSLRTTEPQEPVQLRPGTNHGTPGSYGKPNHCRCFDCLEWRRTTDNSRNAAQRQPVDPVDATQTREHLEALQEAVINQSGERNRNGRPLIAATARVPLGQLRMIMRGAEQVERALADRILAVTADQVLAGFDQEGSRGRAVTTANQRIDSAPTFRLLDELRDRGFGPSWVGRELGYLGTSGIPIRRDRPISRRIAESVEQLYRDVGDLHMPPRGTTERRPSLAELRNPDAA